MITNKMDLFELIPYINTPETAIQFLRIRSVQPLCPTCQRPVAAKKVTTGKTRASGSKGTIWRCPKPKNYIEPIWVSDFFDVLEFVEDRTQATCHSLLMESTTTHIDSSCLIISSIAILSQIT
jgi:hypothetical protein